MLNFGKQLTYQQRYAAKIDQWREGKDPSLCPGEFVQFLLDKYKIRRETFDKVLGCAPGYFQNNIFNTLHNDSSRPLPVPLQEKMVALTNRDEDFWKRRVFFPSDAYRMRIDITKDLSHIIDQYANVSGAITRQNQHPASRER